MRRLLIASSAVALWLAPAPASSSGLTELGSEDKGTIVFTPIGLKNDKGKVLCGLFKKGGWLEKGVARKAVSIEGRIAKCVFTGVPFGDYAIAAFHDEDDSGAMNKFLGLPTEPYCFSRDNSRRRRPPSFDQARFRHAAKKTSEAARMK